MTFTSRALRSAGPIIGQCDRCGHHVRRGFSKLEADGTRTHIGQVTVPDAPFAIGETRMTCGGVVR